MLCRTGSSIEKGDWLAEWHESPSDAFGSQRKIVMNSRVCFLGSWKWEEVKDGKLRICGEVKELGSL